MEENKKQKTEEVKNTNGGMFSVRLESLISAALQDGVLTDQEKEILKKRVEKEDEDWDEVEMIINARLAEMQPVPQVENCVEKNIVGENYNVGMPYLEKTSSKVNQESNDDVDGEGYYIKSGKRIIIPTSTEVIKEREFAEIEDIEKVVFPSSLIKIESNAFSGCTDLVELDFSHCLRLKEIGESAFLNCGLKSVDLSRCTSLETIGEVAFCGCKSLTNIVFPNSLCDLGGLAFGGNEKLSQIDLAFTNIKVLNDLFGTTGQFFSNWGKARDMKKLKKISFPASIQEIPEKMCYGLKALESVDLSKCTQLKRICESAFACTPNLKEVLLSDSIEVMEQWAFGQCGNIKHIDMPPSIKEMGYGVFVGSKIESIDFSKVNRLKSIPEATFAQCGNIKNVVLPASLKDLGEKEAFSESSIESVDFSGVTHLRVLPSGTFYKCHNLKNINLPDCIKVIDSDVFLFCEDLTNITMPASLVEVGEHFFVGEHTALKHIDFSKVSSLEVIPSEFIQCDSIKMITIPMGVKTIEDSAFFNMIKLEKMFLPPTLEHFGTFGYSDIDLYCFAPQLDELEPLVDDFEPGDLLRLYVLPQYLRTYVEQRDAEGISDKILCLQAMPDEYLYFYDN